MSPFLSLTSASRKSLALRAPRASAWALLGILAVGGACSSNGGGSLNTKARAQVIETADEALGLLQQGAAALGQTQLTSGGGKQIEPYLEKMGAAAKLVAERGKALGGGNFNAFVDATLRLAGVKSSPAAGQQPASVDELLAEGKARKVERLDRAEMNDEIRRLVNWIGHIVYFREKRITDQLVPADSQLRKEWDKDADGRIDVPLPPFRKNDDSANAWLAFIGTLEQLNFAEPIAQAPIEIRNAAGRIELGD
jgi:hypothetical protein